MRNSIKMVRIYIYIHYIQCLYITYTIYIYVLYTTHTCIDSLLGFGVQIPASDSIAVWRMEFCSIEVFHDSPTNEPLHQTVIGMII